MRKIMMGLILVAAFPFSASAVNLTIEVQNVQSTVGPIHIGLFNSEAAWNASLEPTPTSTLLITDVVIGTSTGTFNVPPGDYAFVLFDDLNNDGVLETNALGLPEEPYALSNNYQLGLSKPSWNEISFTVSADGGSQTVKLIDPSSVPEMQVEP